MSELFAASSNGTLREFFCVGTAAVVIPAARIGWQRQRQQQRCHINGDNSNSDSENKDNTRKSNGTDAEEVEQVEDIVLPIVGGEGSVAHALWERLVDIQEGRVEWEGWSVPCFCEDEDQQGQGEEETKATPDAAGY